MTYTYLFTVPLIATYAIGFTAIKYYEGFVALPDYGIVPKPIELWTPLSRRFNLPLLLCLSVGWSLEIFYFKSWVLGSIVAVTYMPLITALTHSDPLRSEAYTFLAGSLGSISLTLWFTPILFTFPSFLHSLRREGVDTNTIVRLTKFSELNTIRVFFRFLFTVPLLILSVDGIRSHHHINEKMIWTDFLVMISGFGCSISSALTLVVFFPRSIEGEIAARDERRRSKSGQTNGALEGSLYESRHELTRTNVTQHSMHTFNYGTAAPGSRSLLLTSPLRQNAKLEMDSVSDKYPSPTVRANHESRQTGSMDKYWADEQNTNLPPLKPNRKKGDDIELASVDEVKESSTAQPDARTSRVNHMVYNFVSSIGMLYPLPPLIKTDCSPS
ncbi:hypothetical protein C0993_000961 [Termitomyces sp. T159_Od127]|nr:hypothetical protein C0993_000961 [Termitomyces sp. T159_Od127]